MQIVVSQDRMILSKDVNSGRQQFLNISTFLTIKMFFGPVSLTIKYHQIDHICLVAIARSALILTRMWHLHQSCIESFPRFFVKAWYIIYYKMGGLVKESFPEP